MRLIAPVTGVPVEADGELAKRLLAAGFAEAKKAPAKRATRKKTTKE